MAKPVILATFDNVEKAQTAVEELIKWDQYFQEVELGAIQMFTKDESGQVVSQKVGRRAAGKGSKAGLVLGAIAGVLSGGLTIVGGLAAGALLGGVGGSLFRRGLGLDKAEVERITADLDAGKAIVGVLTKEEILQGTVGVLESLGGKAQVLNLNDEDVEQIEAQKDETAA